MSKLIGTNPNQVPSNADLGSAAFMDKKEFLLSRGSSIYSIDAVLNSSAVDVFIYDTSKDSDGGAWRKRTQDTSWYNEKLNTSVRGSRKEFPAVAVIVAESTRITIYDGDDPNLPMWMVFTWAGAVDNLLGYNNRAKSAITAINGYLITCGDPDGIHIARFVHDDGIRYTHVNHVYTSDSIANRTNTLYKLINTSSLIVASTCNTITATVLPTAPVDNDTGLPIPTIAMGAKNGLSIIKDDGTIINRTTSFVNASTPGGVSKITFDNPLTTGDRGDGTTATGGGYWYTNTHYPIGHSADGHAAVIGHASNIDATGALVSSDGQGFSELMSATGSNDVGNSTHWTTSTMTGVWMNHGKGGGNSTEANSGKLHITPHGDFSNRFGLHKFLPNYVDPSASAVAFITKDYNTGYMPGKVRLATLSNTNAGTNTYDFVEGYGNFTDGSAWTTNTGWSTSGNVATKTAGTGSNYISKSITRPFVADRWYRAEINLQAGSASSILLVNRHRSGVVKPYSNGATNVDVAFFQVLGNQCAAVWQQSNLNTTSISLYAGSAVTIDDFKVYEIDSNDRSIVGDHPFDIGRLTKTPVAPGADLMGYSGFSGTNGIAQPYTSKLDPGTGDYCFMIWFKTDPTTSEQTLGRRFGNPTVTGGFLMRILSSSSLLSWYTRDTSSNVAVMNTPAAVDDGLWHMAVGVRDGNRARLYLDGIEVGDISTSANSHDAGSTAALHIGVENTSTFGVFANPASASTLTLARYSLTAPTAVQIKEIYEHEKALFKENAKSTIYGTSDAITALAYDNNTELLHAGTSAGRSDFQGLRRINNTTRAITTAISSVDGFVVEE